MSKKSFIQAVVIRSLPKTDKTQEAIKYGEDLWEELTYHGYGDAKTAIPTEKKDWFKALNPRQRKWFISFWSTFNYKHGRNEAAQAWMQLGERTDEECRQIVDAAGKESQRMIAAGSSRMMAQGWLNRKRYQDYQPKKPHLNSTINQKLMELNSQLRAVKKLYEMSQDDALLEQITKLEQAISDARR